MTAYDAIAYRVLVLWLLICTGALAAGVGR